MKYRVSFYRKSEVVKGRAPRYMVDVESPTQNGANVHVEQEAGVVIRSVYKAPDKPIRSKPSYVFETAADRNKWYSSHKATQKERLCHKCGENEVERYKRLCVKCLTEREDAAKKTCVECGVEIPKSSHRRYCDTCATKRKETQEKSHREKRAKLHTIKRIEEQVTWAQDKLQTTQKEFCPVAPRYQGLRIPHVTTHFVAKPDCKVCSGKGRIVSGGKKKRCKCLKPVDNQNRCRACLQKFIEVQTIYLTNLKAGESASPIPVDETLMEDLRAHAASNAN